MIVNCITIAIVVMIIHAVVTGIKENFEDEQKLLESEENEEAYE